MFKYLQFEKNYNFNKLYNPTNYDYLTIFPDFFNKKQLLLGSIIFKKIMHEKNLNFFLKNQNSVGNNIVVFKSSNLDNVNLYNKLSENFEKEDNKKYVFSLKKNNCFDNLVFSNFYYNSEEFSFFFNYGINININVEIYKILVILYFLKKN